MADLTINDLKMPYYTEEMGEIVDTLNYNTEVLTEVIKTLQTRITALEGNNEDEQTE